MEGILRVTPEKLISTSEEFNSTESQIKSITTEMMNLVTSMNSFWQGEASTAYLSKFKELQDDMDRMDRMIKEHVTDLQEMAKVYQAAEQANVEQGNSLNAEIIQ